MTEAEWLAATEPFTMLAYLRARGGASGRKPRLFAVACGRRVLLRIANEQGRRAVDAAKAYADELLDHDSLVDARGNARAAKLQFTAPFQRLGGSAAEETTRDDAWLAAWTASREAASAFNPDVPNCYALSVDEQRHQAALFRCIFGNPFRPAPVLAPAVLAWDGGTASRLAAAIYDERAFNRLPVLADALEDAGCADAEILGHCRSGGEHVRGCWAVDLVLGKA
jgi:hypothetical protein